MRFLLLAKATADFEAGRLPDEQLMSKMADWNEALVKAGARLGADRLHPSSRGARVRYSNGRIRVTDGPFAETKELVAGFCLIRAESLAEAVEWAKRMPFEEGEVEIRPLLELEDIPKGPAEKPDGWRDKEEQWQTAPPARKPGTKRYVGFVKADPDTEAGKLPDEKFLAAMGAFCEEGLKAGVFLAGQGLQPSSRSARVRYAGNRRTVIDGPFTETKELIAGYALLQFGSNEEAIEWARRFVEVDAPGRYRGESECEIREVFDYSDLPGSPALERFRKMGSGAKG
jgi:hypothetical protein